MQASPQVEVHDGVIQEGIVLQIFQVDGVHLCAGQHTHTCTRNDSSYSALGSHTHLMTLHTVPWAAIHTHVHLMILLAGPWPAQDRLCATSKAETCNHTGPPPLHEPLHRTSKAESCISLLH